MFLSAFAIAQPLFYGINPILRQKRYIWAALSIALMCTFSALHYTLQANPVPVIPIAQAPSTKAVEPPTAPAVTQPTSAPAPASTPPPAPQAPAAATIPNCTPPRYRTPSQIDLSNKPLGLTQIADATDYYQVFGNTAAQIKAQLRQCPAIVQDGNSYGAVANGTLTWHYVIMPTGTGSCSLTSVKIGMHTNMLLPKWHATAAANSGLAAQWQRLISNLELHENGHITIYQQSAKQLLSDLQSLPADNCDAVAAAAIAKTASSTIALKAANHAYDDHTGHGATQGAVLR